MKPIKTIKRTKTTPEKAKWAAIDAALGNPPRRFYFKAKPAYDSNRSYWCTDAGCINVYGDKVNRIPKDFSKTLRRIVP